MKTLNNQLSAANDHHISDGFKEQIYNSLQNISIRSRRLGGQMHNTLKSKNHSTNENGRLEILGYEICLRNNKPSLIVRHKATDLVLKISTDLENKENLDSEIAYIAGWLAGSTEVLSGRVNALNLGEAIKDLNKK